MPFIAWVVALVLSAISLVIAAYAKKVGENASTKCDIAEITDKIESVKARYGMEIEEAF
jgi:hypothetical protein